MEAALKNALDRRDAPVSSIRLGCCEASGEHAGKRFVEAGRRELIMAAGAGDYGRDESLSS